MPHFNYTKNVFQKNKKNKLILFAPKIGQKDNAPPQNRPMRLIQTER